MRHLPKTVYTKEDQRADTNFLVGASYGRLSERDRIITILKAKGLDVPKEIENA